MPASAPAYLPPYPPPDLPSAPAPHCPAQACTAVDLPGLPVTGTAVHYPAGHVVPWHTHPYGHVIYAQRGLLRVQAASGQWLVPPTAAVWLRPHVAHQLSMPVALQAHGLFVREADCTHLPSHDCVVHVSSLLRELILAMTGDGSPAGRPLSPQAMRRQGLLGALVLQELEAQPPLALHLPWPAENSGAPLQRVCQALVDNPGDTTTASAWAGQLAMSGKTLERRFLQATGMSFGKWRQQLRLLSSLPLLMQGLPITQVALSSGYDSHSAYATAFRKQFGYPPSHFAEHP